MSLWDAMFGRRNVKLSEPGGWNLNFGSASGKAVTPDTALQLATAWACIRLKSRTVGTLPLGMYSRQADGSRKAATDHPLYTLIHDSPNADQTAAEFWSGQTAAIDLWGNAYAEKIMRGDGQLGALDPMRPDMTTVFRDQGVRKYRYAPPNGPTRVLDETQVFHLRGFTVGGDVGLSAISYGRQTLGASLAADEAAARFFANGLQLSGFIENAGVAKWTKEQRDALVELFQKFAGSTQSGKVMPLPDGAKFAPLGMNPEDAQLLQTRAFHVEEICRWFDMLPVLIGHAAAGQTMWGSGIEQLLLGWVQMYLAPFLGGIEQAIIKQLLSPADRAKYYAEFNLDGLLRADSEGRAALYSSAAQNGWMFRDEIRAKENLPPIPGGQIVTVQSNLVELSKLGETPPTDTPPGFGQPAPKRAPPIPPVAPPKAA